MATPDSTTPPAIAPVVASGKVDNTQLDALVADLETKEQALMDAGSANDAAQAAAAAAAATAAGTSAARDAAKVALNGSADALTAFVAGLKS